MLSFDTRSPQSPPGHQEVVALSDYSPILAEAPWEAKTAERYDRTACATLHRTLGEIFDLCSLISELLKATSLRI